MSNETDHLEGFWGRINHPVFGVFASAWVVINWELIYTLVRGLEDVSKTITEINTVYLVPARYDFLIWKPLGVTLLFLFSAPILRKGYELWKELVEKGRDWLSKKMDKATPVPKLELDTMKKEYEYQIAQMKSNMLNQEKNYTNLSGQLQAQRQETQTYKEAWELASTGGIDVGDGQTMNILSLVTDRRNQISQVNSLNVQLRQLLKENKELKAKVLNLEKKPSQE